MSMVLAIVIVACVQWTTQATNNEDIGKSLILVDYDRNSDTVFKFNTDNMRSVLSDVQDYKVRIIVVIGSARLGKSTFCK